MVKKSACRTRRTHGPAFKVQVALATLRDDKTMAELCMEFEVRASQTLDWKRQLLEGAADVFGAGSRVAHRWTWRLGTPRSASWPWRMIF